MHSLSLILQTLATVSVALFVPASDRRQLLSNPGADTYRGLTKGSLGPLAGQPGVDATYDYVVTGCGTSGSALGTRLAQAGHSVAIIEGGDYYEVGKPDLGSTPGGDFAFVGSDPNDADPFTDWRFVTTKQPGANGREVHYARGECLGGSYVSPV